MVKIGGKSIQSLDGLEYVLNSHKTNIVQAREAFRLYFTNYGGQKVQTNFNGIGASKFQMLFGVDTPEQLVNALDNPVQADYILRFVKVK